MRDREDKFGIDSQGANVAHIHPPRPGRQISSAIAITTTPSARFTPTQRRICTSAAALTALFWMVLFAGSALLGLIGIKFMFELITKPIFAIPVTGIAFGTAFALALAALNTLLAPSQGWLMLSFILLGASSSGDAVSGLNIILEFAAPEDRPTYIGLTNTLLAPTIIVAPILGGWLATVAGFVALVMPAGAGIREAALAQLIIPYLDALVPNPQLIAWASAIVLRVVWLATELILALALYPLGTRRSKPTGADPIE